MAEKTEGSVASNNTSETDKKAPEFTFSRGPSMEDIRSMQSRFCTEREWEQYHTPRNLLLALVREVGELAEIFQWRGEVESGLPGWSEADREHAGEEMSDILMNLVRLADVCRIDLPSAVTRKFSLNAEKYPADKAYGSMRKYTAYQVKK